MEKGHSFLEVIVISAIICMTVFSGLEIFVKAIDLKNKSSFNFFLTLSAVEKMDELKNLIKIGKKPEQFEDSIFDPVKKRKIFRRWELKWNGSLIEIKVVAYTKDENGRRVEISDYFWIKGGF